MLALVHNAHAALSDHGFDVVAAVHNVADVSRRIGQIFVAFVLVGIVGGAQRCFADRAGFPSDLAQAAGFFVGRAHVQFGRGSRCFGARSFPQCRVRFDFGGGDILRIDAGNTGEAVSAVENVSCDRGRSRACPLGRFRRVLTGILRGGGLLQIRLFSIVLAHAALAVYQLLGSGSTRSLRRFLSLFWEYFGLGLTVRAKMRTSLADDQAFDGL